MPILLESVCGRRKGLHRTRWNVMESLQYCHVIWASWRLISLVTHRWFKTVCSKWQYCWAFVRGIHRWLVDSLNKESVTFPGHQSYHSNRTVLRKGLNTMISPSRSQTVLGDYRQVSNISRTKSQYLKHSRTVLRLSLPNPLKPDVNSRMKM